MHYSFHSTPTCTFKSRTETTTRANQPSSLPGPADYTVKKPLPQTATIAQSFQSRNLYKTFEPNPGPGAYEAKSYITAGTKRSMSQKFIDYNQRTPGPQDYEVRGEKVLSRSPAFSMGNKSKSTQQITLDHNAYKPAPTNYSQKDELLRKSGVVIGTATRQDLTQTEKTPAPNYYMTASAADFAAASNPRCKFGAQSRKTDFNRTEQTPGPAFYKETSFVEENSRKKKGYSCRQRVSDLIAQEISKFPAPGLYESHLKNKSQAPQYSTAMTKRKTFMDDMQDFKKELPGPGTHESPFTGTKYRCMSAKSFGKDVRKPLDENQKTPGPMEYQNDRLKVMNAAPKFSVTKTVAKNEFLAVNPETPGPGQHDPKLSLVKPSSAISEVPKEKRPDYEKHRHTPGPGFYNLRGKEQGPTWKFPSEKRISFTDRRSEAKDGTHYEITSKVVDPPSYMRVSSKLSFSPSKSMRQTGFSGK